jgi:hypothetical protein
MHDFVIKTSRDAGIAIADIPVNKDGLDESPEEILDRLSFSQENLNKSEDAIIDLYDPDSIEILLRKDDIWKCFSYYEKYLIYLHDVMGLKKRQMVSILRHEKLCGVEERLADITEKCRIISNEGENQLYIIYLQVNSISKLLIENETVSREDLLKEMNSLNGELYQLTQEVVKNSVPETE